MSARTLLSSDAPRQDSCVLETVSDPSLNARRSVKIASENGEKTSVQASRATREGVTAMEALLKSSFAIKVSRPW
jgi:hypothetical protein